MDNCLNLYEKAKSLEGLKRLCMEKIVLESRRDSQ
jgi:hypothetical protein